MKRDGQKGVMSKLNRLWVCGVLVVAVVFSLCGMAPAVFAAEGLEPLETSKAYQEFLKKPANDLAKMICVLNYFRTAPVVVQYEGIDYPAQLAYPVGLVYLMTNYRNEDPQAWIKKNCYRTLSGNSIIYLKFQDGKTRPARDVLLEKFRELEEALGKRASKA